MIRETVTEMIASKLSNLDPFDREWSREALLAG